MHQKPVYAFNNTNTALLAVDAQKAFGTVVPVPDAQSALSHMRTAIHFWKKTGGKVYLTKHIFSSHDSVGRIADFIPGIGSIMAEGSPHTDFHKGIEGDVIILKNRFNALIGTDLEKRLKSENIKTVVVCGLTTPICVQATVDGLFMADFQVAVLSDACASQPLGDVSAQQAHQYALERLRYVFAQILTTDEFILHS
ncbi:MAG: cysteine hydrolase [bacterium]|nr:cysteine hydrolase [bacterium]